MYLRLLSQKYSGFCVSRFTQFLVGLLFNNNAHACVAGHGLIGGMEDFNFLYSVTDM